MEYYITADVVTDSYDLLIKDLKNRDAVVNVMGERFQLFMIYDTNAEDCINALHSGVVDYEDAVLAEVAKRNKVDYIITRNEKDYVQSVVKSISPKEFLQKL